MKVLLDSDFGKLLLSLFGSYLRDRKQFFKVFGVKSDIIDVPSGVPRNGHLFPSLFPLYIDGIESSLVTAVVSLFC